MENERRTEEEYRERQQEEGQITPTVTVTASLLYTHIIVAMVKGSLDTPML